MTGTRLGQQQTSAVLQDLTTKVEGLTSPGPAFTDPTTKFILSQGPDSGHVQIAYRTATTPGIKSVQIYRNLSQDFGSAILLTELPASQSEGVDANYADISTTIAGKKTFYWLRIMPTNLNAAPIIHSPQSIVAPP